MSKRKPRESWLRKAKQGATFAYSKPFVTDELIHVREVMPDELDRIAKLEPLIERLREALEYYAKPSEFLAWTKEHPEFFALYESLKETFERAGQKAKAALAADDAKKHEGE